MTSRRTVVLTGGTSGFGAIAVEPMGRAGATRLLLGARRPASVGESLPLDLTELDSVRAFAMWVRERLGDTLVDSVVLNAGVIRPDVTGRTADGLRRRSPSTTLPSICCCACCCPPWQTGRSWC